MSERKFIVFRKLLSYRTISYVSVVIKSLVVSSNRVHSVRRYCLAAIRVSSDVLSGDIQELCQALTTSRLLSLLLGNFAIAVTYALPQAVPALVQQDAITCPAGTIPLGQKGPDAAEGMTTLACCPYNTYLSKTNDASPLQCSYSWFSVPVIQPDFCNGAATICKAHPHACCLPY